MGANEIFMALWEVHYNALCLWTYWYTSVYITLSGHSAQNSLSLTQSTVHTSALNRGKG